MTRRRPSLVTESPLQVWLARRTAWKRDLLSGAERLNNWLAARDELPLVEIGRELGLPLQMGLESGEQVAVGWLCLLLLESPAVHRNLRLRLLERLSSCGVYHDLGDLPETTGSAVAALLVESLNRSGQSASGLSDVVRRTFATGQLSAPTSADAMFLADTLKETTLTETVAGDVWAELFEAAVWIRQLPKGTDTGRLPNSELFRRWLCTAAFRGIRRNGSRISGRLAGSRKCREVPRFWQPEAEVSVLPEGYGAMVVEWALACLRAWPDREQLVEEDHTEIYELTTVLIESVGRCLERVEGRDRLKIWLEAEAARLISFSDSLNRLRAYAA